MTRTPEPNGKSNFAGFPEVRQGNGAASTLDLNSPIYPGDKTATTGDVNLPPTNRYEKLVNENVKGLSTEADFTAYTQAALNRDADRFPPVRNDQDGTTTYTIEQIGLTDRELNPGDSNADHFKRLVNITVPDDATSLKECKFEYGDRQTIGVREFDALVDHSQKRQADLSAISPPDGQLTGPKDMTFYTHGVRTGAEEADFSALTLQLTNGHSVINVDWKSAAIPDEKCGVSAAYDINCKGAAESYPKFEKELDRAINHIGASKTDLIAFSHGAMFDTKYLQHRIETNAPKLDEIVFSHPDVKCSTLKPVDATGSLPASDRFYSRVARQTFVIGSTSDWAMTGAAIKECESAPKGTSWLENHNNQMRIHARLGNGGEISRNLVAGHGGTYITEADVANKSYNHFLHVDGIAKLLNARTKDNSTKIATMEK